MILKTIKSILYNNELSVEDKLIEIQKLLQNKITIDDNSIVFDGSKGYEYVDNPRLKNQDDIYYTGSGCTWGIDLDGNRYWKRYDFSITKGHKNLSHGDIIDEKARIKKYFVEFISEI